MAVNTLATATLFQKMLDKVAVQEYGLIQQGKKY